MYDQTFSTFANNQIRHHATHKVDCQHGHFNVSQGFMWICMNLTYSLYPPPPHPTPNPNKTPANAAKTTKHTCHVSLCCTNKFIHCMYALWHL